MVTRIQRLFEHAAWADTHVLNALIRLGDPPPLAIREFAHILGASETWLSRIEGRPARYPIWPDFATTDLAPAVALVHGRYRDYLAQLDPDRLSTVVAYTNSAGRAFETRLDDILWHVVLHAQYHRGKVNRMLREAGAEPAPVDFIGFVRGAPAATTADRSRHA